MNDLIFDNILRQREEKNEKIVAYARLCFISFACLMDLLAYFQVIQYTEIDPDINTLSLDALFILFSALVLFIVLKFNYQPFLKFLTITMDYSIIGMMVMFDPTIPREPEILKWIIMIASIFIFMYNLIRFSKVATIYSACLSVIFYLLMSYFTYEGLVSDSFPILLALIMILMLGYYITKTNADMMREANTKKMMERFLPPQLLGELYKHQDNIQMSGNQQTVSILFSDIRAFTELSESLHPSRVVTLLNDYLTLMTDIIFKYEGTIDKFIGDAIMTIYGAPIKTGNEEIRSIFTALEMIEALPSLNAKHPELLKPIEIGIGIHTGEVIIGNIGSNKRLDYTAIGDNVNLTSRIESLTKFYQCEILISESTFSAIHQSKEIDDLIIREIDTVQVKGKSTSVQLYQVIGKRSAQNASEMLELKKLFETSLALYKNRNFETAEKNFRFLETDSVSRIYAKRCRKFIENPPDSVWDGIFVMDEK